METRSPGRDRELQPKVDAEWTARRQRRGRHHHPFTQRFQLDSERLVSPQGVDVRADREADLPGLGLHALERGEHQHGDGGVDGQTAGGGHRGQRRALDLRTGRVGLDAADERRFLGR